jgi:hypothetical protein
MRTVPHKPWFTALLVYIGLFLVLLLLNYRVHNRDLRSLLYVLWLVGALPGFVLLMKRRLLTRLLPPGAGCRGGVNVAVLLWTPVLFLFLGPVLWLGAVFMWPSEP